jgi:hypothetical protein
LTLFVSLDPKDRHDLLHFQFLESLDAYAFGFYLYAHSEGGQGTVSAASIDNVSAGRS